MNHFPRYTFIFLSAFFSIVCDLESAPIILSPYVEFSHGEKLDARVGRDYPFHGAYISSKYLEWKEKHVIFQDLQWAGEKKGLSNGSVSEVRGMGVQDIFFTSERLVVVLSGNEGEPESVKRLRRQIEEETAAITTPEPSTYLILGSCLLLVILRRKRQELFSQFPEIR